MPLAIPMPPTTGGQADERKELNDIVEHNVEFMLKRKCP